MKKKIYNLKINNPDIKKLNAIMVGNKGVGKSSFLN